MSGTRGSPQALIHALRSDGHHPDYDRVVTAHELYDQVERSLRGTSDRHLSYVDTAMPMASLSRAVLAEQALDTTQRVRLDSSA